MQIVTAILRAFQLLCTVIVLGISISLIRGQAPEGYSPNLDANVVGKTPSQTTYAAFCGGWGLLISLVGLAALFVVFLQGIIMAALDVLTGILLLAGGIALAVALHGGSCSDDTYIAINAIIRGAGYVQGGPADGTPAYNEDDNLAARCHGAQADTAFLFLAMLAFFASAALELMHGRRGKNGGSYA